MILPFTNIKIWDKDELVRDFKLCKNPEGLIGYYDFVSEKFFVLDGCDRKGFAFMKKREFMKLLEAYDDDLTIMIPNIDWTPFDKQLEMIEVKSISQGVNEYDGCLFIDSYIDTGVLPYVEEDDV